MTRLGSPGDRRRLVMLLATLSLGGCASSARTGETGTNTAPGLDLGLVGPETPASLVEIAKAPYALPAQPDCAWLHDEIARLDALLGPDVDVKPPPDTRDHQMGRAATDAVVGLVPYRGVVRWLSGAGKKEHARAVAVLTAAARRGFLKGVRLSRSCVPGEG